jgi:hypothetical protein
MMFRRSLLSVLCPLALSIGALATAAAQQAQSQTPPMPIVAASGRASTGVSFDGRLIGSIWLNRSTAHSGPAWMTIDYGQPHARGREIFGGLVPFDEVWRLGANMATHLTLDLNVRIGDQRLDAGFYTLYLLPRADGAELIVNRELRQWGTEYDPSLDVGRVPLSQSTLPGTVESLTITLQPDLPEEGRLPTGTLRIAWGTVEYSVDWAAVWP